MKQRDWIILIAIFILTSVIGLYVTTEMDKRFEIEAERGKAELRQEIINKAKTCGYSFQVNSSYATGTKQLYFHCCQYDEAYQCTERNGLGVSI